MYLDATATDATEPSHFLFPGRGPRGVYPKPTKGTWSLTLTSMSRRVSRLVKDAKLIDNEGTRNCHPVTASAQLASPLWLTHLEACTWQVGRPVMTSG